MVLRIWRKKTPVGLRSNVGVLERISACCSRLAIVSCCLFLAACNASNVLPSSELTFSADLAENDRYNTAVARGGQDEQQEEFTKINRVAQRPRGVEQRSRGDEHAYVAPIGSGRKRLYARNNREALYEAFKPNEEFYLSTIEIEGESSPRCRRILADTGIETELLRSPTVSTSVNTKAEFGIGISYDFVDLKRANLKEELALAQCYRSAISMKLTQLLVTSFQSSTRAGYLAKARSLRNNRGEFSKINGAISHGLSQGSLTLTRVTILRQHLNQIKATEAKARLEASRREIVDRVLDKNYRKLDSKLVEAERRIHDIEERARTANAIKLSGSVGYNVGDDGASGLVSSGSNITGKIKLSVRLGAFTQRRHELEQLSRQARVEEYYERESGVFWRSRELVKANRRMLTGLRQQRADIIRAMAQARKNSRIFANDYDEELLPARIRGRIDLLALKSSLAGVNATIADIIKINQKLRFKS